MPKERLTQVAPGYRRSFLTEGGKSYRKQSQDIAPVIEHVKHEDVSVIAMSVAVCALVLL